jgi:hypothetical protein
VDEVTEELALVQAVRWRIDFTSAVLHIGLTVLADPGASVILVSKGKETLHRHAVSKMLEVPSARVDALYAELGANSRFQKHIGEAAALAGRPLGGFPRPSDLYVICRVLKPNVIIETGVASGLSSSHILQALEDNSAGKLYSIDLPNADNEALLKKVFTRLPEGKGSGWVIPDWLKGRWELRIGKSSDLLAPLLRELGSINLFLHDSEHSYENMMFEFGAAWPTIAEGGFLLSDDVYIRSSRGAFNAFAKSVGRKPERIYSGFGSIKK